MHAHTGREGSRLWVLGPIGDPRDFDALAACSTSRRYGSPHWKASRPPGAVASLLRWSKIRTARYE